MFLQLLSSSSNWKTDATCRYQIFTFKFLYEFSVTVVVIELYAFKYKQLPSSSKGSIFKPSKTTH